MKIAVYLKSEDPAQAPANHSATKTLWAFVLADGAGRNIAQAQGQLTTGETWRQLKDRLRPAQTRGKLIPRLKAIYRQFGLDLDYPHKGQESVRHPHEAFRRECALAQARREAGRKALAQAPTTT